MPTTIPLMDNCCTCGASQVHASVRAVYTWPGFPSFNAVSPGTDTLNVRYLTMTITILDDVGNPVTKSITGNNVNGCMSDTVTGVDCSADGSFGVPGLRLSWPPDSISTDGTTATWAAGQSIVLSNPVDVSLCLTRCTTLINSVTLASLTLGTDARLVTYDAIFSNPAASWSKASQDVGDWLALGVFNDPTPGIMRYGWGDLSSGALLTTDGNLAGATFNPFENVTPAINNQVDPVGIPPSPGSMNSYTQESGWTMRKSISNMVSAPVCCEDDYFGYASTGVPAALCQMIADDGAGHLILNPPALTFVQADSSRTITRTPYFGTALTGGGCPCH